MNDWLDIYNSFAKGFDDAPSKSGYVSDGLPFPNEIFTSWVSHINQIVNLTKDDTVYDAGCGSGIFLAEFGKFSNHLYGCDGAAEQIAYTSKVLPSAHLVVGDVCEKNFPDKSFDFIFCNSVFLLFDSYETATKALDTFSQLIRAGGVVWIGDVPDITADLDENFRRTGRSSKLALQHFPTSFFENYCSGLGVMGRRIEQDYKPDQFKNNRYDFLINF